MPIHQMFELLKSLSPSLTMFSLVNWQSTIRDLVKFHPEYSQITRWPGHRETADLVYDDGSGDLTRVLIERGYLDGSWEGCTPNFLLEVKTTTGPCETPFFMSKTQYERVSTVLSNFKPISKTHIPPGWSYSNKSYIRC